MVNPFKTKASGTRFMHEHEVKYGLKITHRNPKSLEVISVQCEFCVYFGSEEEKNKVRMRAKKETKMSWTNNFRTDLYQHHHKGEHPSAWENYQAC